MVSEPISSSCVAGAAKAALAARKIAVSTYLKLDGDPTLSRWSRSVIDRESAITVVANPEESDYAFVRIQFARRSFLSGPNDRPPRSWSAHDINSEDAIRDTDVEALHWLLGATTATPAQNGDSVLCELEREQAIAVSDTPELTRTFLQHERVLSRVWLKDGAISQFTLLFAPVRRRLRTSQPGSSAFVAVETGATVPALVLKPSDSFAAFDRFTSELLQNWPGSDRVNYSEPPAANLLELEMDGNGAKYKLD